MPDNVKWSEVAAKVNIVITSASDHFLKNTGKDSLDKIRAKQEKLALVLRSSLFKSLANKIPNLDFSLACVLRPGSYVKKCYDWNASVTALQKLGSMNLKAQIGIEVQNVVGKSLGEEVEHFLSSMSGLFGCCSVTALTWMQLGLA